jgi:hypothetical protein
MFHGDANAFRIIQEIKASMTHHPVYEPLTHETTCMVLDDEQWHVYKKHLAKVAKDRKTKTSTTSEKKKKVRDRRDMEIEAIEISSDPIVRICDATFCITKFKNIEEVSTDKVYCSHVLQALRGDATGFGGYFWCQRSSR